MINEAGYFKLKNELDEQDVMLIAVSKRQPPEKLHKLYELGHRDFGENQAQALANRQQEIPLPGIHWHFIGHLQTNKVKYIAPFVDMIHSVDSLKILKVIDKEAHKSNRIINCLLQVHIAIEETKFGLGEKEVEALLDSDEFALFSHTRICGLMGMATFTEDIAQVRNEFASLRKLFFKIKDKYFNAHDEFKELSMGMSDDYTLAVNEGSTMVRIGTRIFGERLPK